jgi:hypothetical protein
MNDQEMFSTEDVDFLEFDVQSAKIEFWHSDEIRPFLICEEVDRMVFLDDEAIEVYNRDYQKPIFVVNEWSFWRQRG